MKSWGISARILGSIISLSPEEATNFINNLVTTLEMTAYGKPIIQRWNDESYTILQLIETSNITLHVQNNRLIGDVFTCRILPDFETRVRQAFTELGSDFTVRIFLRNS